MKLRQGRLLHSSSCQLMGRKRQNTRMLESIGFNESIRGAFLYYLYALRAVLYFLGY